MKRPGSEALPTSYPVVTEYNCFGKSPRLSLFCGSLFPKARLQNSWVSGYLRNSLKNPAGLKAYYSKSTLSSEVSAFPAWSANAIARAGVGGGGG